MGIDRYLTIVRPNIPVLALSFKNSSLRQNSGSAPFHRIVSLNGKIPLYSVHAHFGGVKLVNIFDKFVQWSQPFLSGSINRNLSF